VATDSNGSLVTRYEYDAFGKIRWQSQTDTRNKNTFVGGHGIVDDSDDDGLIYMRARYYDSEIGRFISRDPYTWGPDDERGQNKYNEMYIRWDKLVIGHNLYKYSVNNPIRFIDKDGKLFWIPIIIGIEIVVIIWAEVGMS